jgi:sarcosine oxidase subunit alpha
VTEQPFRLPSGGRVDRTHPMRFVWDGRAYEGLAGDTLASALLANGIHLTARSFKYHRPRGIFSAGAEEPNALVSIGLGADIEPNARATLTDLKDGLVACSQNRWPSVAFDLGAAVDVLSPLLSAGFYYKTFMGPKGAWRFYEWFIRRAAGLGRAPRDSDPSRYDKVNAHCDVLVVGAGAAGLAAALAASRTGARVVLVDEQAEPGGALLASRDEVDGQPAAEWVAKAVGELASRPDVRRLSGATAFGYYDHNFVAVAERLPPTARASGGRARERLWRIRAKRVVLASGAIERSMVFADNDRPGIMLAAAVRTYINRYAVRPGTRAVVATNNDDAYRTALDLAAIGIEVAAIVDTRPDPQGALPSRARAGGLKIEAGSGVFRAEGRLRVRGVEVGRLDDGNDRRRIDCDLLAVSGGWNPTLHLYAQSGGKVTFDERRGLHLPADAAQATYIAGAVAGAFDLSECLRQGFAAGAEAARLAGFAAAAETEIPAIESVDESDASPEWSMPAYGRRKRFVDLHTDVTESDLRLAIQEGYRSVEHVKRYTTLGMGPDQGKTGNVTALGVLSDALDASIASIGTTTYRPPYMPITFGTLAGRQVGALYEPLRTTPMDAWHAERGAVFEPVGQWRRARYYPRGRESMAEAADREVKGARRTVGLFDASTLGKIDIPGPDAATLLDRVYSNDFASLAVGRCRYGLMLSEDGMVRDDGVTARLGPHHYHMTTTTGGAASVLQWIEDWRQTEWIDLKVFLTSVTEQWAVATLSGPKSRDVLAPLTEIDLGSAAFPFMSVRSGQVAGIRARVFRVSFSGDLSYEVNVPARFGRALWTALYDAGQPHGLVPYGTEALHVLRAEKGFIVVGHETDGTTTPIDLGLDGMVSKKKDFLGKRSLARSGMQAEDRKQLVGLLTKEPKLVLPEGAQIVERPLDKPLTPGGSPLARPVPMIGHVTSSYMSPTLERSIAMALVKSGRSRKGQTVYLPMLDGRTVEAEVTRPMFYDPEGARRDG